MKTLVAIIIIAVLLVGCAPSKKSIQVSIALTQTAYPTSTPIPPTPTSTAQPSPTPDLRVIDIDPQKLLLEKSDLPTECKYILPGPEWIEPLRNTKIVSNWTVEKGKKYLAETGRIDGWIIYFYCSNKSAFMPDEVSDNVVIYSSVEGTHITFNKYNERGRVEDGFTEITDAPKVGDLSTAWVKNDAYGESKTMYFFDFTYRNILHTLYIWGSEEEVKLDFAVTIAKDLLIGLQEQPLSDAVYFTP